MPILAFLSEFSHIGTHGKCYICTQTSTQGATMLKISYTVWAKHADNLYCRVRERGKKPLDVNLHTKDRHVAEAFVRLRQRELELYNSYLLAGEAVPEDVERKLLRRDSPAIKQKGPSERVFTVRDALDSWETFLRRGGYRERTIATYTQSVRLTIPMDAKVSEVTKRSMQEWLAKHDHLSTATRKSYSVGCHEFAKHLISEYGAPRELMDEWNMIRVQETSKSHWTMSQMYHIIEDGVQCRDKVMEEQFKVYLWVMATAGLRQNECAQLRRSDYADGKVTVRAEVSKTRKERTVPLDMRVCEMIERMPKEGPMLFGCIPKSQGGRFSMLQRAIKRSGMPGGSLHQFRRSVARILYAKCTDITKVAALLGHSPQVSMKFYAEARQSEDLAELVKDAYSDEQMIPSALDAMIREGLI